MLLLLKCVYLENSTLLNSKIIDIDLCNVNHNKRLIYKQQKNKKKFQNEEFYLFVCLLSVNITFFSSNEPINI